MRTPHSFLFAAATILVLSGCSHLETGAYADNGQRGWAARLMQAEPQARTAPAATGFVWRGSICYAKAPQLPDVETERRVMKRPERSIEFTIAPEVEPVVTSAALRTANGSEGPPVPVTVPKVTEPGSSRRVVVPAEFVTFETDAAAQIALAWAPTVCEGSEDEPLVLRIQESLAERGYYEGPLDGRLGPLTRAGLEYYKRERNLYGDGLTVETLTALGITVDLEGATFVTSDPLDELPVETGTAGTD